jgi:nucleolar protein 56
LAKYPASTVQILGAEKALFRALKTRGNTPKYGLLFHSSFIGRAGPKNKGRISRFLANKCSIASRIDCFSELPTGLFGEKLREQVEERLVFYDSGAVPRKNITVMKEVMGLLADHRLSLTPALPKSDKKKKKKIKQDENGDVESSEVAMVIPVTTPVSEGKKKKKKREREENAEIDLDASQEDLRPKKKKKSRKSTAETQ